MGCLLCLIVVSRRRFIGDSVLAKGLIDGFGAPLCDLSLDLMVTYVFDLSSDARNFLGFIRKLRDDIRDPDNPTLVNGVARLTSQVDNPQMVDIELRSGGNVVTIRARTDNLYVIGFMNGAGNWFEFAPENNNRPHLIGGATWLSDNGSYTNNGIGSLNQDDDILGQPAVRAAIQNLSNFGGTTTADTRRHLRTLIVNFIESTRLDSIANIVDPQMSNPSGAPADRRLRSQDITLIRRWSALSEALRNRVNNPAGPNPFRRFFDLGIENATDAARVLGMVLIGVVRCNMRRSRRSIADVSGLTLVEVVGVVVVNIDDEGSGQLYGTITLTDGFGTTTLFSRDKSDTQSVGPNGWVDITWPTVAIDGADDFVFDFDLWDHDNSPTTTRWQTGRWPGTPTTR